MKSLNQTKKLQIPKVDDVNFIHKSNGLIKGYSVNTFHGMAKNYNQDRVSIIMNISKPNYKGRWPKCSYFGVFDGHGGNACSDFLKQNMHKYITENQHFPHRPIQALKEGFKNAESQFIKLAQSRNPVERSGSCALVLLVIDQTCYIANVGDSRAILSTKYGKNVYAISRDHKPDSQSEKSRIFEAGGNIYQSSIKGKNGNVIYGPFRIEPGKLSVSRSFGDIQAKKPEYGGNPKVLIAKPQITYFTIDPKEHDFIMMGSDGIFDKMYNQDIVQEFWNLQSQAMNKTNRLNGQNQHNTVEKDLAFIGKAASRVIMKAMENTSLDNLTTLFVVFEDEGKLMDANINYSRQHQSSQVSIDTKKQRIKSSAVNYNSKNENQVAVQFALRRQISRKRLNESSKIPDLKQSKASKVKQEEMIRKDYNDSVDKIIKRKKSIQNLKQQEQNRPDLANIMASNQQYHQHHQIKQESMNNKPISSSYSINHHQKALENKNIGSSNSISPMTEFYGELKRKKSQGGLVRKDLKKESVWAATNRGIKNNEKVIQKIRY